MQKTVSVALVAALVSSITACGAKDAAVKEEAVIDSATAMLTAQPHTMADYAGTWSMLSTLEGTPNQIQATLSGAADSMMWTLSLQDRPNIPIHVMAIGDSLIGVSDAYESVLRKGVSVVVRTATALTSPNTMEGSVIATYTMPTGVEKVSGTTTATRVP